MNPRPSLVSPLIGGLRARRSAASPVPWRAVSLTLSLWALALVGCDEPDGQPPPTPDAAPPPMNCFSAGCPPGETCQNNGRCATADEVAAGVRACTALSSCLGECPDQLCIEQCLLESSDEGYRRYIDVVDCLDVAGCFTAEGLDQACMFEACGSEYSACFGALPATPEGTLFCGAFVRCINGCPTEPRDEEQACLDGCVAEASPAAFERYAAAVDCIQLECVDQPPNCQQERCGDALAACFDHGLGEGVLPCADVMQCVFSCPDSDCYARCEQDASAAGLELWRDFVDCAAPAGCAGFEACLAACPVETRACQNDR